MSSQSGVTRRTFLRDASVGVVFLAGGFGIGWAVKGGETSKPSTTSATLPNRDIRAVGVYPLTGVIAADGQEMLKGAKLAVKELNAGGGVLGRKVNFSVIDEGGASAEEVTKTFQRAVNVEKADAVFSGYHLGSGPEFDIIATAGIIYINVQPQHAFSERFATDPAKYFGSFQMVPNDTVYGSNFVDWLERTITAGAFKPKKKTAAIIAGDDAYDSWIGKKFKEAALKAKWAITAEETFTVGNVSDWGPLFSRVRANPPAVVFTTDFIAADDAAMAKEWAANPIPSLLYQQYGPSVPEYLDLAKDAANGVLWAANIARLPDSIGQSFVQRYQNEYGETPGWTNAAGCYDNVMLWAAACSESNSCFDYKRVAAALETIVHRGVTGGISLRKDTHILDAYPSQNADPSVAMPTIMMQVQKRQHQIVAPEPFTTGSFELPVWV